MSNSRPRQLRTSQPVATKIYHVGTSGRRRGPNASASPAGFKLGASGSLSCQNSAQPNQGTCDETPETKSALSLHYAIVGGGTEISQIGAMAVQLAMSEEELGARCGISRSTLHRRKLRKENLSAAESDILARHALLLSQATGVFEEEDAARHWLHTPQPGLGHRIPLDLARSTTGFREVEKLLTRIDQGVYA